MALSVEKKTPSWDDIPSLEGVEVEWGFKPENPLGKRAFVRMSKQELSDLFQEEKILVKIATVNQTLVGQLSNLCKGGLALHLHVPIEENLPVKVGFFLGSMKIISKALVRRSRKIDALGLYDIGLKFVDLNPEMAEYIVGLYSSKVLHHAYR